MKPVPENYRDLEASFDEWEALSEETRLAICNEYGYRKRPDAPQAKAIALSETKPPPLVSPQPPTRPATEAEGQAALEYCMRRRRELGLDADEPAAPKSGADLERDIQATWNADPITRAEFMDLAIYSAFRHAETAGRVGTTIKGATAPIERPSETTAGNVRGLTLEEDTVRAWHNDPSLRHEFASLDEYAMLRRYVAGVAEPSDPPARVSQERLRFERAREEDRAAGVDPRLPAEERALEVWRSSAAIRHEFRGDRAAYVAERKHIERRR